MIGCSSRSHDEENLLNFDNHGLYLLFLYKREVDIAEMRYVVGSREG